ncbi:hypothetical protein HMPREF9176_0479 [Streptococcus downei F0415]|nr:hypothetical protein HMPREF9176_0479 [Streptococcus downei F0415]
MKISGLVAGLCWLTKGPTSINNIYKGKERNDKPIRKN